MDCNICGKQFSSKGIGTHKWRVHGAGVNHHTNLGVRRKTPVWNRGLRKDTDIRVRRNGASVSSTMQNKVKLGLFIPNKMTQAEKEKLSIRQSLNNSGGKSKWFEINNIKVQGTWELEIAEQLLKEKILWCRPHQISFKYKDKLSRYTPDFYLLDYNSYLEVKGFWWGNDKQKMIYFHLSNPDIKIQIIDKDIFLKIKKQELNIKDFILSGNSSVECLAEN